MAQTNVDGIVAVIKIFPFTVQFVGSMLLGFGYRLLTVACAWEILQLTDSAYWVGLMTAAALLPVPVLSLLAGAVADRLNRRLLVILSTSLMTMMATAMTVAVALDVHTPTLLMALAIGMGVGIAFFDPSWLASIPDLVPRMLVPDAVTFNSAGNAVVWSAGTAAAGVLVAASGVAQVLAIASAGYASMTIAALVSGGGFERNASASPIFAEMLTGIRHMWHAPDLPALLAIIALFALGGSSLQTLLPVLSVDVLDGSSGTFGLLLGCFGAGSVLGLMTRRLASHSFRERMVALGILLFAFAGVVIGLSTQLLTISVLLVVAGATWTWIYATISAAIQLITPSLMQARVMSIYTIAVLGSMSLGSLVAGVAADQAGPKATVLLCSLGTAVLTVAANRLSLPPVEDLKPS